MINYAELNRLASEALNWTSPVATEGSSKPNILSSSYVNTLTA